MGTSQIATQACDFRPRSEPMVIVAGACPERWATTASISGSISAFAGRSGSERAYPRIFCRMGTYPHEGLRHVSDMHPHACRLICPNGMHLAYPDIAFALFPLAPLIALFSIGSGNARHAGSWAMHPSTSRV